MFSYLVDPRPSFAVLCLHHHYHFHPYPAGAGHDGAQEGAAVRILHHPSWAAVIRARNRAAGEGARDDGNRRCRTEGAGSRDRAAAAGSRDRAAAAGGRRGDRIRCPGSTLARGRGRLGTPCCRHAAEVRYCDSVLCCVYEEEGSETDSWTGAIGFGAGSETRTEIESGTTCPASIRFRLRRREESHRRRPARHPRGDCRRPCRSRARRHRRRRGRPRGRPRRVRKTCFN